jgi:hypothetical protein
MELFFGDAEPLYILASNVQPDFGISQKSSLGPGPIRGPDLSFCLSGKISTKEIYQININKYHISVSGLSGSTIQYDRRKLISIESLNHSMDLPMLQGECLGSPGSLALVHQGSSDD